MVNKVTLIGNLGRDPELFHTQSGRAVARLSIATNEMWMKDGERQRRTEWHRVVVWGPPGELIRKAMIEGFKKAFPDITIEYSGARGGEQATRIQAERGKPECPKTCC